MKKVLLHTPEGVRDIYNRECERKLSSGENTQRFEKLRLS